MVFAAVPSLREIVIPTMGKIYINTEPEGAYIQMKEEGEIPLEIHTNETIERFNEDVDDELLLRLYHDEENNIYKPTSSSVRIIGL